MDSIGFYVHIFFLLITSIDCCPAYLPKEMSYGFNVSHYGLYDVCEIANMAFLS